MVVQFDENTKISLDMWLKFPGSTDSFYLLFFPDYLSPISNNVFAMCVRKNYIILYRIRQKYMTTKNVKPENNVAKRKQIRIWFFFVI